MEPRNNATINHLIERARGDSEVTATARDKDGNKERARVSKRWRQDNLWRQRERDRERAMAQAMQQLTMRERERASDGAVIGRERACAIADATINHSRERESARAIVRERH